jgi:pimeloyl-ACP methyl ester carboxylesterase
MKKTLIESLNRQNLSTWQLTDPKHRSLAILLPGYLDSKDYPHLIRLADALFNQGYDVTGFDPLGTWESEGQITDYTLTNYLKQIDDVIQHHQRQKGYQNLILIGHSLGGLVALVHAASRPFISAVVAIMSPPSIAAPTQATRLLHTWETNGVRHSTRPDPHDGPPRQYQVPFSFAQDALKYNALDLVHRLTVPKLFLSGELDELIVSNLVQTVFEKAAEPKEYVEVKKVGHDYRLSDTDISTVNQFITSFLRAYSA